MNKKKKKVDEPTSEQLKAVKDQQVKRLLDIAKIYEDTLEPKVVLLFRRMEEMIAASQMPLIHINLVLDMLKKGCIEMAYEGYVTKGAEKLMKVRGGNIG